MGAVMGPSSRNVLIVAVVAVLAMSSSAPPLAGLGGPTAVVEAAHGEVRGDVHRGYATVFVKSGSVWSAQQTLVASANPDHVARFWETHACAGCDLSEAHFAGIQAPNAKLANANLRSANLYGASLKNADLSGAILDGANLEMANLDGATGAVLGAARTDPRTTCPDGTAGPCR
jgi:hypothetical protein